MSRWSALITDKGLILKEIPTELFSILVQMDSKSPTIASILVRANLRMSMPLPDQK